MSREFPQSDRLAVLLNSLKAQASQAGQKYHELQLHLESFLHCNNGLCAEARKVAGLKAKSLEDVLVELSHPVSRWEAIVVPVEQLADPALMSAGWEPVTAFLGERLVRTVDSQGHRRVQNATVQVLLKRRVPYTPTSAVPKEGTEGD